MKIIIVADTMISGKPVPAGPDVLEVDDQLGWLLISASKAEKYAPPPAPSIEETRAELLEKIAVAETQEELEELLAEDPDIVVAFEKRLRELEEAKK